jgi:hypothetical protein
VELLVAHSSDLEIAHGFAKLQRMSAMKSETIGECFMSRLASFLSALGAKHFTLVEVLSANDPDLC